MDGAAAKALRPTDARRLEGILRRLGALWEAPALAGITVVLNPRLSRTLGRLVGRPWRIELCTAGPRQREEAPGGRDARGRGMPPSP